MIPKPPIWGSHASSGMIETAAIIRSCSTRLVGNSARVFATAASRRRMRPTGNRVWRCWCAGIIKFPPDMDAGRLPRRERETFPLYEVLSEPTLYGEHDLGAVVPLLQQVRRGSDPLL